MKRVKTLAELHRSALASGASVSMGSARFNSTGSKLTPIRPAPTPAPTPAPAAVVEAPAAPAPVADTGRIEQMLERILASAPQPQAPASWSIKVVRDERGLLADILLTRN